MSSSLSRLQVIPQEARGRVNKKSRAYWHDSTEIYFWKRRKLLKNVLSTFNLTIAIIPLDFYPK